MFNHVLWEYHDLCLHAEGLRPYSAILFYFLIFPGLLDIVLLSHFSCVRLFATLWSVACQASLYMGILQAKVLEWVAMPSSRGAS